MRKGSFVLPVAVVVEKLPAHLDVTRDVTKIWGSPSMIILELFFMLECLGQEEWLIRRPNDWSSDTALIV